MQLHDSFGGMTRPWGPRKSTNEDHSPGLDEKQRFRKGVLGGRNLNHHVHWSNLYICLGLCVTCYCTFKIFVRGASLCCCLCNHNKLFCDGLRSRACILYFKFLLAQSNLASRDDTIPTLTFAFPILHCNHTRSLCHLSDLASRTLLQVVSSIGHGTSHLCRVKLLQCPSLSLLTDAWPAKRPKYRYFRIACAL